MTKKPEKTVRTQIEVAQECGVSRRTVCDWVRDPTFPRNSDGSYPLVQILVWWVRRKPNTDQDLREQKLRAEIRKIKADTYAKQLRNDVMEGRKYVAADVDFFLNSQATMIKNRLEQIPDEVAAETPPEDRVAIREACARTYNPLLKERSKRWF